MDLKKQILFYGILSILIFILISCMVLRPRYDKNKFFNITKEYKSGKWICVDKLHAEDGFDSLVLYHVRLTCKSHAVSFGSFKIDEPSNAQILFGLSNKFVQSDPEAKELINSSLDPYKYSLLRGWVGGNWVINNENKNEQYIDYILEGMSLFEVKSRIKKLDIERVRIFLGSGWMDITTGKSITLESGKLHYLGTITAHIDNTNTQSKNLNKYNTYYAIEYDEKTYSADIQDFKKNYPLLYEQFKDNIIYYEFK